MQLFGVLWFVIFVCTNTTALKVLIYSPTIGHSHLQFVGKLADILVNAGHYVHVIVAEIDEALTDNGTKLAQQVTRFKPPKPSEYYSMHFRNYPFSAQPTFNFKDAEKFINVISNLCRDLLNNQKLINELRADQYDIALTEFYDFCSLGYFEMLGIKKVILLAATPITDLLADTWALPSSPSYVSGLFGAQLSAPNLSFKERLINSISRVLRSLFFNYPLLAKQNALFKELVRHDFPDLKMLAQKPALAFINTLPVLDISRPISSKIIFIGGITSKVPTVLDKKFLEIYKRKSKGVVLFSLGSLVNTTQIPPKIKNDIIAAFAKFSDYNFIVKMQLSKEEIAKFSQYKRIHFFDWIDQVNLINHEQTKAFITHGGLNSVSEAAMAGCPLICIPIFADQHFNTAIVRNKHLGVYIEKNKLDKQSLTNALDQVLNHDSYAKAAATMRTRIARYPYNLTQQFVQWIEYVAQFDDFNDFDLHGTQLSIMQYFLLDVIAVMVSIVLLVCLLLITFIAFICQKIKAVGKSKND